MKEHWSVSKEKLVNLEEGLIRGAEVSCTKTTERSSTCKQLIQCAKLVLYLELLLFVGWACYSIWQTYRIESMEVKVTENIQEAESRSLLEQHTVVYDRSTIAPEQFRKSDDVLEETKFLKHLLENERMHSTGNSEIDRDNRIIVTTAREDETLKQTNKEEDLTPSASDPTKPVARDFESWTGIKADTTDQTEKQVDQQLGVGKSDESYSDLSKGQGIRMPWWTGRLPEIHDSRMYDTISSARDDKEPAWQDIEAPDVLASDASKSEKKQFTMRPGANESDEGDSDLLEGHETYASRWSKETYGSEVHDSRMYDGISSAIDDTKPTWQDFESSAVFKTDVSKSEEKEFTMRPGANESDEGELDLLEGQETYAPRWSKETYGSQVHDSRMYDEISSAIDDTKPTWQDVESLDMIKTDASNSEKQQFNTPGDSFVWYEDDYGLSKMNYPLEDENLDELKRVKENFFEKYSLLYIILYNAIREKYASEGLLVDDDSAKKSFAVLDEWLGVEPIDEYHNPYGPNLFADADRTEEKSQEELVGDVNFPYIN